MGAWKIIVGYSVDTSILIRFERYYPQQTNKKLWDKLEDNLINGNFLVSKMVIIELEKKANNIATWIKSLGTDSIIDITADVQAEVTSYLKKFPNWINPNSTRNSADPFVIALAKTYNLCLLSNEARNPTYLQNLRLDMINKNSKIPDIAKLENLSHIDIVQYLSQFI